MPLVLYLFNNGLGWSDLSCRLARARFPRSRAQENPSNISPMQIFLPIQKEEEKKVATNPFWIQVCLTQNFGRKPNFLTAFVTFFGYKSQSVFSKKLDDFWNFLDGVLVVEDVGVDRLILKLLLTRLTCGVVLVLPFCNKKINATQFLLVRFHYPNEYCCHSNQVIFYLG